MESRPFLATVPDQSLFADGAGEKGEHARALRASDGSFAMIYLPVGREAAVSGAFTKARELRVWWFNPRDGRAGEPLVVPRSDVMRLTPPASGGENDWVLVLDDAAASFGPPGDR
jgi:hypothetical protein